MIEWRSNEWKFKHVGCLLVGEKMGVATQMLSKCWPGLRPPWVSQPRIWEIFSNIWNNNRGSYTSSAFCVFLWSWFLIVIRNSWLKRAFSCASRTWLAPSSLANRVQSDSLSANMPCDSSSSLVSSMMVCCEFNNWFCKFWNSTIYDKTKQKVLI